MNSLNLGRRGLLTGVAALGAAALMPRHALAAGAGPALSGPLPDTQARGLLVWDPTNHGYVAEEYLLSGVADVYKSVSMADAVDANTRDNIKDQMRRERYAPVLVKPAQPYTTRLVIYRPADPARFSGNVIVETCHPLNGGNQIVWSDINNVIMQNGDVYLGLQHPATLPGLAAADAARYGALSCAHPSQLWTMLIDAGRLARSASAGPFGGLAVRRLYMTGYSYTGVATATFADYHHGRAKMPDGRNIFDGYAPLANAMYVRPLDVPVIRLNTQSDFDSFNAIANRAPDSDGPFGAFRHYELAGAAHVTTPPPRDDMALPPRQTLPVPPGQPKLDMSRCTAPFPKGSHTNDYPTYLVIAGLFKNLYAWVDKGVPPPRAPRLTLNPDNTNALDAHGNALGGLRLPQVAAPVATYGVGAKGGDSNCWLYGYTLPFALETRKALYGDHAAYVAKVQEVSQKLLADRWLLPGGAARLVELAQASDPF